MRNVSFTATRVILVILAVAALLPLLRLIGGGLWEPWELHRAEAAREIAAGDGDGHRGGAQRHHHAEDGAEGEIAEDQADGRSGQPATMPPTR